MAEQRELSNSDKRALSWATAMAAAQLQAAQDFLTSSATALQPTPENIIAVAKIIAINSAPID